MKSISSLVRNFGLTLAESRVDAVRIIASLGFLVGIVISPALWMSNRLFPLVPVFDWFPKMPTSIEYLFLVLLVVSLVGVICNRFTKMGIVVSVCVTVILILFDITRLQPWVYQYVATLCVLGFYYGKRNISKDFYLGLIGFIIATVYIYSGIHKLHPQFSNVIFPEITKHLFAGPSIGSSALYSFFANAIPWVEIGIGFALLNRRPRTFGIIFAAIMFLVIMITIGPLGVGINSIVWPWDIALLLLAIAVFYRNDTFSIGWPSAQSLKVKVVYTVTIILFGLMPVMYSLGFWDSYLSWSVYSGTPSQAWIFMSSNTAQHLPLSMSSRIKGYQDRPYISVSDWALSEIKVIPYPEDRVYIKIGQEFCRRYSSNGAGIELMMSGRYKWFTTPDPIVLTCEQL